MKFFLRILFIIFSYITLLSCKNNFKKYIDYKDYRIYELQCNGKYYLTLENCNCKNLPKNYFVPIGDKRDHFYVFYLREEHNQLKIYSLYDEFEKYGDIEKNIDFIVSNDNTDFIDLIEKNNFKIFKGYSHGNMKP